MAQLKYAPDDALLSCYYTCASSCLNPRDATCGHVGVITTQCLKDAEGRCCEHFSFVKYSWYHPEQDWLANTWDWTWTCQFFSPCYGYDLQTPPPQNWPCNHRGQCLDPNHELYPECKPCQYRYPIALNDKRTIDERLAAIADASNY